MSNDNRIKTGYPHIDKPWLQFYNEKTKQYFINHEQSGESRRDTKDPDER